MTQEWDITTDLLVAGTGAAAMGAAIAASDEGKKVLVVESTDKWGGTTFISGGGIWLPDNPVMQREGVRDSKEAALEYLESVVNYTGPASSRVRKLAFLNGIADSVSTLERLGVEFVRSTVYPDYFSHKPGGSRGRSLDVKAFDIKKLGDFYASTRHDEIIPLPLQTDDFAELALGVTSPKCIKRAFRIGGRIAQGILTRRKLRGMGVALSCALMHVVRQQGTPVWLNAPITRLIIEDGVAVGAIVTREGKDIKVRATRGVFLGTGGFGRNAEWRQKHHGHPGWSTAAEGDMGTGIQVGIDAGADTALMELAWGTPAIPFLGDHSRGVLLIWERSMPHSITIDQHGKRYINEALPYAEFVQGILDHNADVPCVPSWIVTDRRHTRKYLNLASTVGISKLKRDGTIVDAPTLRELAQNIGVPADDLEATVARFNGFVRKGVDEDFHRGENEYENYYGDPTYPNPNLGELSVGPFRALKMMPGDLGTKGGLLTDEHARVLDTNGKPIDGLYASGNATATVMGQSYPGAGGTLGPALVFGFIGGRHACGRDVREAHATRVAGRS